MTTAQIGQATRSQDAAAADAPEREVVGWRFLEALAAHDFEGVAALLGPTMRMRALEASGYKEYHGAEQVLEAFYGWFGTPDWVCVEELEAQTMGDRLQLRYRFVLDRADVGGLRIVEQHAYCKVQDGRIVTIDLVCSGFRPR